MRQRDDCLVFGQAFVPPPVECTQEHGFGVAGRSRGQRQGGRQGNVVRLRIAASVCSR